MQRIIDATAAASLPAAPTLTGTSGYFTEGTPGVSSATRVRAWWANMVQEEMMALLTAAGITPDTTGLNNTQILAAIRTIAGAAGAALTAAAIDTALGFTPASATALSAEATTRAAADAAEAATRLSEINIEGAARALIFSTSANVIGSRTMGTFYTNSLARPMHVSAWGVTTAASANLSLTVAGVTVFSMGQTYSGSNIAVAGMVPAGSTYTVANSAGVSLSAWVES